MKNINNIRTQMYHQCPVGAYAPDYIEEVMLYCLNLVINNGA